jgi:hypothetical protein
MYFYDALKICIHEGKRISNKQMRKHGTSLIYSDTLPRFPGWRAPSLYIYKNKQIDPMVGWLPDPECLVSDAWEIEE